MYQVHFSPRLAARPVPRWRRFPDIVNQAGNNRQLRTLQNDATSHSLGGDTITAQLYF